MAGMVPQRARTAGLKREERPGMRDGPCFPQVQISARTAIDLPAACSAGQPRTAQKCSQYKPTLKGIMLTCRNVC